MNRSIAGVIVFGFAILAVPGHAADVMTTHRVSAALANEAVGAAVAECGKNGWLVSATFLDSDGVRQAVLRGDGAGIHTVDTSYDKAYTAVTYGVDSITQVENTKGVPSQIMAREPHILLSQGGVVVKIGNEVVGSLGVSGAPGMNRDTGCARVGLAKIADRLK